MLDSLINLPQSIPSLWKSLNCGKKRRAVTSRGCSLAIEGLEARELLSATNGGEHGGVPRIINGTNTTNFAAVGELTFTPTVGNVVRSTGTLIATDWVLTSASASIGLTESGGTASVVLGGVTYTVDDIVTYPKYYAGSIDYKQDLALWHLTSVVPSESVTPLNVARTPGVVKATVTLVGFGGTGTGTTGSNGVYGTKQFATTKIERVSPSQLVWKLDSNSEGTNSPTGDTGGPVLRSVGGVYEIVGVASAHSGTTGKIGDTSYNTRVDLYAGWIDDVLERAHPTNTVVDDYIDTADTVGTTNRKFTFNSTVYSADFSGKFGNYGDVDVFKIVTALDGYATFDLKNAAPTANLLDTKLEILDADGETVLYTSDDMAATNLNSYIGTYLGAGTYFVRVSTYADSQKGAYRLTMKDNFDNVPDTFAAAKSLTPNSLGTVSSDVYINTTTDIDYFKFRANKSGKYQFDFTHTNPESFDPVIEVYSSAGALLAQDDDSGTGLDAKVVLNSLVSGTTYYVKLSGYVSVGTGLGSTGLGKLSIRKIA